MCEEGRPTWTPRATCLVQDVGALKRWLQYTFQCLSNRSVRPRQEGRDRGLCCGERDGTICGAVVEHHPVGDPDHRVPTKTPARSCPNGCANSMLLKKSLGSPPT